MRSSRSKPGGRCEYCGERLTRSRVHCYRQRGNRRVLFERIPALVCRSCGHRIFEPAAVEAMELELNRRGRRGRSAKLRIVSA